jgi:hypothetical protein
MVVDGGCGRFCRLTRSPVLLSARLQRSRMGDLTSRQTRPPPEPRHRSSRRPMARVREVNLALDRYDGDRQPYCHSQA